MIYATTGDNDSWTRKLDSSFKVSPCKFFPSSWSNFFRMARWPASNASIAVTTRLISASVRLTSFASVADMPGILVDNPRTAESMAAAASMEGLTARNWYSEAVMMASREAWRRSLASKGAEAIKESWKKNSRKQCGVGGWSSQFKAWNRLLI